MTKSLLQMYVHIVFSTKNRKPYLKDNSLRNRLYQYMNKICENHECKLLTIGGVSDHVHFLLSLNKKISISKIIEEIKSSSSKWIKSTNENVNEFYWQNGYGAFSVSQSNLDKVVKYIQNQESHHKKLSFKEELEKLLKVHQINFDEKQLWS